MEVNYSNRLKELRKMTGYTQKEFANLFEMPWETYSNWETGERRLQKYLFKMVEYKVLHEIEFISYNNPGLKERLEAYCEKFRDLNNN